MGLSNSKAVRVPEFVDGLTPTKASGLVSGNAKCGSTARKKQLASSASRAISAESLRVLLAEASLMHRQSSTEMEDEYLSRGTVSTEGSPDVSLDGVERAHWGRNGANATRHHPLLGWLPGHRTAKSPPSDSTLKPPHHVHVIPSTTRTSNATRMTATSAADKVTTTRTTRKSLSANSTPTRSSKLPIPRKRNSIYNDSNRTSYDDDDVEHLKRLYQARTWEMYYRITEARKRSSLNDLNNATATTGTFDSSNHHPHQLQLQPNHHPHAFLMPGAVAVHNIDNINNNPYGYCFYNNNNNIAAEGPLPTSFHHHQHQADDDDSEHELFMGDLDC